MSYTFNKQIPPYWSSKVPEITLEIILLNLNDKSTMSPTLGLVRMISSRACSFSN